MLGNYIPLPPEANNNSSVILADDHEDLSSKRPLPGKNCLFTGQSALAAEVNKLADQMPRLRTDKESIALGLPERAHGRRVPDQRRVR